MAQADWVTIDRTRYADRLYGFWLGQCIANWTGLVTEMDKIGNVGEVKTGAFYTRADWGQPDQPSIWAEGVPSDLSPTIDFVFRGADEVWGADDDTDIEYMYQHLLARYDTAFLTPEMIREGWLTHIRPDEENYLWVANQRALDLLGEGMLPPDTGSPVNNEHYDMIDAQLTTEVFGFFAPGRPDIARSMAYLPIRTVASGEAAHIAELYVTMYSLAAVVPDSLSPRDQVLELAAAARPVLPDTGYAAAMYDFVLDEYLAGTPWEATRDSLYERYQVRQADGYDVTSRGLYCNGCFAAGINFAAGMVSLFYGEGDIVETIKIGTLAGWDSDNPTATWGGLLGFLLGRGGVEQAFGRTFSDRFNIHRTRRGFPRGGLDTFPRMAAEGVGIVDRVVTSAAGGKVDCDRGRWIVPAPR
ncbi:ADP-ribosylglycohydrolase family protein [Lewinella sp. IMCC34183]|uniref:ADP-ribosylglycohydrolase family protein n=1 Tax=Lewinella sp. IMCC34183 TaxID=2248762 RepID=UPI001E4F103F|nr:ADP-ribosylglycohydrolase family protein [Lewinella sp. IMCC34183]